MSPDHDETSLCARVLDRLVEGDDLERRCRPLAEHLGSCVTCFRALTELRDAPRVAEALRAEAPVLPPPDDRFWDDLAARTTVAAQTELQRVQGASHGARNARDDRADLGACPVPPGRAARRAPACGSSPSLRRWRRRRRGSCWSPAVRCVPRQGYRPRRRRWRARRAAERRRRRRDRRSTDATADEEADVAELDVGALHRLLDRLRPRAPAALTAAGGGASDAADVLGDDEAPCERGAGRSRRRRAAAGRQLARGGHVLKRAAGLALGLLLAGGSGRRPAAPGSGARLPVAGGRRSPHARSAPQGGPRADARAARLEDRRGAQARRGDVGAPVSDPLTLRRARDGDRRRAARHHARPSRGHGGAAPRRRASDGDAQQAAGEPRASSAPFTTIGSRTSGRC